MTTPKPPTSPVIPSFPCPQCGMPSQWTDNPSRPFCTERCKLIDLGAWANEEYRVPEQKKTTIYDLDDDEI